MKPQILMFCDQDSKIQTCYHLNVDTMECYVRGRLMEALLIKAIRSVLINSHGQWQFV